MDESKKETQTYTVEDLKSKGNECVKNAKYIEAVLHYTHALKMDPNNYVLYSNRSFAFLKLDQHYLSLQDANETVRLQPQWAKGYFRRAEVEAASGLYDEAIISYTRALQLDPQNPTLIESIKNITDIQKQKNQRNQNVIWLCTCIGLVTGIAVVVLDYTLTTKPTLKNPLAMVAFSMALAGVGWAIGKSASLMNTWSAGKSLQPPEDLAIIRDAPLWVFRIPLGGGSHLPSDGPSVLLSTYVIKKTTLAGTNNSEKETIIPEKRAKYSKAQARQRFKQGKL